MAHDASKVLLGGRGSNIVDISNEVGDPATFKAGLAVRRATTGALQLEDDSVAPLIGVSIGPALDDSGKTAVVRTGNYIPIRLKNDAAAVTIGDITFTSKLFGAEGNDITVTLADTETGDVAEVTVDETDITVGIEGGVTKASTIVEAIEANAEANALVSCEIAEGEDGTAQAAASETALTGGSDVAVPGAAVKIDDTTGEASVDGDTTAATYLTGPLTGIDAVDSSETNAAYISLPGGF